eukprot:scaffold22152_cov73-Skeletonema_marinoi.AAC.1
MKGKKRDVWQKKAGPRARQALEVGWGGLSQYPLLLIVIRCHHRSIRLISSRWVVLLLNKETLSMAFGESNIKYLTRTPFKLEKSEEEAEEDASDYSWLLVLALLCTKSLPSPAFEATLATGCSRPSISDQSLAYYFPFGLTDDECPEICKHHPSTTTIKYEFGGVGIGSYCDQQQADQIVFVTDHFQYLKVVNDSDEWVYIP